MLGIPSLTLYTRSQFGHTKVPSCTCNCDGVKKAQTSVREEAVAVSAVG